MKLAVFSDVHGNREAFERVLEDMEGRTLDGIVCLGDAVGYGPDPEDVVQLILERNIPCVMGNHEFGLSRPGARRYFNAMSVQSLDLTRARLSERSLKVIAGWPKKRQRQTMHFVHGCPPGSVLTYLFELDEPVLQRKFSAAGWRDCFVGHTHELELVEWTDGTIERRTIGRDVYRLRGEKCIVNIGSVGQPRDGDNRAKYVIFDSQLRELEVRYVDYNIQATVDRMQALGFPAYYADRLW